MAWFYGPAVYVDAGHVSPCHRHHPTRHVLVAATDDQNTVHPLSLNAGLNAVRNDLAGDQGILHAFCTHGHPIGDGRGAEYLGITTGLSDGRNGRIGQFLQSRVTGRDGGMGIGYTHHGLVKVVFTVTHGVVHGTIRGAGYPLGNMPGATVVGHGTSLKSGRVKTRRHEPVTTAGGLSAIEKWVDRR